MTSKVDLPLSVPEISGNEWKYIKECLDTNWVSYLGSFVDQFEDTIADYVGAKHGVATVNGTAALHTALLVAGIEAEDEVLVSTLTFIAPVNAIRYMGAWPVFIDSEPKYLQMDANKVVEFLEKECRWTSGALYNKVTGRRIKAILPVHILGHPVDMDPIVEIARKYDLIVIEDAAESLGARYKGKKVGHLGDISCFSFNGNKVITTGGGGMIATDNESWALRAKHLTTQAKSDKLEYLHDEIGYNYRMNNIQAAMGLAQMEKLNEFIDKKRQIAATYSEGLKGVPNLVLMCEDEHAHSTYWLYTLLVGQLDSKQSSRELIKQMNQLGIHSRPLWLPAHLQKMYGDCLFYGTNCAENLYDLAVQLPSSVGLTDDQANYVLTAIRDNCKQ